MSTTTHNLWRLAVILPLLVGSLFGLAIGSPPAHAQPDPIELFVWSADGSHLAALSAAALLVYDMATPAAAPLVIEGVFFKDSSLAFSFDNRLVALDGIVYALDTGAVVLEFNSPIGLPPAAAAFSPDGSLVAFGDFGPGLHIVEVASGAVLQADLVSPVSQSATYRELAFSPDGSQLVGSEWGGIVTVWDSATWQVLAASEEPTFDAPAALRFSADGAYLIAQDFLGQPYVWEAATLTSVLPEALVGDYAEGVGFLSDGRPYVIHIVEGWTGTPTLVDVLADTTVAVDFGDLALDEFAYPAIDIRPNDTLTYWDSKTGVLMRYDLANGGRSALSDASGPTLTSPDGAWVVFVNLAGGLAVWDGTTVIELAAPSA